MSALLDLGPLGHTLTHTCIVCVCVSREEVIYLLFDVCVCAMALERRSEDTL